MEDLIQADNNLVDKSAKYIRSIYPSELTSSSFVEKRWWIFGTGLSVRSFFRPCRKVRKCNWDFVLSQLGEINSNLSAIETDCSLHSESLKGDLKKSIVTANINNLHSFGLNRT